MLRPGELSLALVLSAVLTVSCSDPQAGTLPTPSPSASSTTPTAPSVSPTADLQVEFKQAINTYYETLNAAVRQPATATDELARLIAPQCSCAKVLDALREEARQERYLDYRYSVRGLRIIDVGELGGDATYVVVQSPGHERDRNGRILRTFKGSSEKLSVRFSRNSSGWLLERAARVQ